MPTPKPGDYVPITHCCSGLGGSTVTHELPVLVTSVDPWSAGLHQVRGVRCDGSLIAWQIQIRDGQAERVMG